jgi:adenylate cyclase, class 2
MPIEVEQKFAVADLAEIERRLESLSPRDREAVEQVDTYFNHPCRDFGQTDEALRLRQVGGRNFFTFKGPKLDTTTKTRREVEIELASGPRSAAEAVQLLEALGFNKVAEVRKHRVEFTVRWAERDIKVALDRVADLGSFVELEAIADEREVGQAREKLASLAQRLEFSNSERRSYLEMLLESRRQTPR